MHVGGLVQTIDRRAVRPREGDKRCPGSVCSCRTAPTSGLRHLERRAGIPATSCLYQPAMEFRVTAIITPDAYDDFDDSYAGFLEVEPRKTRAEGPPVLDPLFRQFSDVIFTLGQARGRSRRTPRSGTRRLPYGHLRRQPPCRASLWLALAPYSVGLRSRRCEVVDVPTFAPGSSVGCHQCFVTSFVGPNGAVAVSRRSMCCLAGTQ